MKWYTAQTHVPSEVLNPCNALINNNPFMGYSYPEWCLGGAEIRTLKSATLIKLKKKSYPDTKSI